MARPRVTLAASAARVDWRLRAFPFVTIAGLVDEGAGVAIDEGLHVADEVVWEADIEAGRGFEPGHEFGGQRDVESAEVVVELVGAAHADDGCTDRERVIVQASATCEALAPSSSATS
jgi:hypothetical protein